MSRRKTKEEFVKSCREVHGDTYDYINVVYVDSRTPVSITCKIHGDFLQAPSSHLVGRNCPKCADHSKTTEQFVAEAIQKGADCFDYSETIYINKRTKVKVVCKKHGEFYASPRDILLGHGCRKCSNDKISKLKSGTQEDFISQSLASHGRKYDYSEAIYVADSKKVKIICPEHGEFFQEAGKHKRGYGCQSCANDKISVARTLSQDDFIAGSSLMHSNKYDYSLVEYTHSKSSIKIICPIHGVFQQPAGMHRWGCGCPKCTRYGYRTGKAGNLYVLQCDDLVKVGITNNKVSFRAAQISKSFGSNFDIVTYFAFSNGAIPQAVETQIHKELREHHEQPTEKFDGYTECFLNVNIGNLITRIGQIAGETFNELNTKE